MNYFCGTGGSVYSDDGYHDPHGCANLSKSLYIESDDLLYIFKLRKCTNCLLTGKIDDLPDFLLPAIRECNFCETYDKFISFQN
jgi:hypothetical protein